MIELHGYRQEEHVVHLSDGKLLANAKLDAVIKAAFEAKAPGGIVINFHGGLVPEERARNTARELHGPYWQDGAGAYPIFFVWETGAIETMWNNFDEILGESLKAIFKKKLFKLIFRILDDRYKQIGSYQHNKVALQPPSELEQAQAEELCRHYEPSYANEVYEAMEEARSDRQKGAQKGVAASLKPILGGVVNEEAAKLLFPDQGVNKGAAGLLLSNFWILAAKVAVGVVARHQGDRGRTSIKDTIIEEILRRSYLGERVGHDLLWGPMKQDAEQALEDDGGALRFLEVLAEYLDTYKKQGHEPPRILLIGHSAGSIFVCEFLKRAAKILPGMKFDVVLEAPAITCNAFGAFILDSGSGINISRFHLFGMNDAAESGEKMLAFPVVEHLYSGSLLYLVSNVLEKEYDVPLLGMQRFHGNQLYTNSNFPGVRACTEFCRTFPDGHVVWLSQDDVVGAKLTHAYMDNGSVVLEKLRPIIRGSKSR